jgi:hypothetical protein
LDNENVIRMKARSLKVLTPGFADRTTSREYTTASSR